MKSSSRKPGVMAEPPKFGSSIEDDKRFLRLTRAPDYEKGEDPISVVDLFSGCGGMTLGLAQALHNARRGVRIPLALDADTDAIAVFKENFPTADARTADVREYFDGRLGDALTRAERAIRRRVVGQSPTLVLAGGPPCQGNSDLNNHSRRRDPRNGLYATMARAAQVLEPDFVVVENVPTVVHDEKQVVAQTISALEETGYEVQTSVLELWRVGVPQRRKRHLLIGTKERCGMPSMVLETLAGGYLTEPRDVRWAIEDLMGSMPQSEFDRPSNPKPHNLARINWLFENGEYNLPNELRPACHQNGGHTYKSVYGRLDWSEPAQTITTGFQSMGQGRYVHPAERRLITPHEAARLQGFPDFFGFAGVRRTTLARLVGNAVPPLVTLRIGELLFGHRCP